MGRLILLKGMNPDADVFSRLASEFPDAEHVDWPSVNSRTNLCDFAGDLIGRYRIDSSCSLVGVSFGGIVAQEIASIVNCRLCVVISSVCARRELPGFGRVLGTLPVSYVFRLCAFSTKFRFFGGPVSCDEVWISWVRSRVITWKAPTICSKTRLVRIHGDQDRTFPNGGLDADVIIEGGGHLIIATHSNEIHEVIRAELSNSLGK